VVGFTLAQGAERTLDLAEARTLVLAVVRTPVPAVGLTLGRVGLVTPARVAAVMINGTDRLPTADNCNSFRSPKAISLATPARTQRLQNR
jgi:hypothetical protein